MAGISVTLTGDCEQCGRVFEFRLKPGPRPRHCSNRCRRIGWPSQINRIYASRRKHTACIECSAPLRRTNKYCSDRCKKFALRSPQRSLSCPECHSSFSTCNPRQRYCTIACGRKVSLRKASSVRRARERQSPRIRFDPMDICDRDGWRCYLCGRDTPRHLRGTLDPCAPEIDHIKPLAAGGEHHPSNVACCCRACNVLKADRYGDKHEAWSEGRAAVR